MKVCYFGSFQTADHFPRNHTLITGLRQNGVAVAIANYRGFAPLRWVRLWRKINTFKDIDAIVVGSPGQGDVWLAKMYALKHRIPVIFDALISLYETFVIDRKLYAPHSLTAKHLYWLDNLSCKLADRILVHTPKQISYFLQELGVSDHKCVNIWVGTDPEVFKLKSNKKPTTFTVYYHGNFIPLQGVPVMLEAAKLLKKNDINFALRGSGQEYEFCQNYVKQHHLTNVQFLSRVPYHQLGIKSPAAHVFLAGPFGKSKKARRAVPNKIFESLAMGYPTIVGDTPACRGYLNSNQVLFCKTNNSKALAKTILYAKNHPTALSIKARAGHIHFKNTATPKILGAQLMLVIKNAIHEKQSDR